MIRALCPDPKLEPMPCDCPTCGYWLPRADEHGANCTLAVARRGEHEAAEVARLLGISEGRVNAIMRRAIRRVQMTRQALGRAWRRGQ